MGRNKRRLFEGDIAGVNIWSVYLEDKDLGRTPTGNEPNLVAAYNMEKRNGNKLEATKGETGIIEDGASWYGKCSYEWYKNVWDENAQMSKYILLPDKEENLEQAEEGDYKVKINYEGYSNQTITLGDNTPIHIGLDDNLSVSIGLSEQDNIICEGEDLQVMPLISGGISEKKYIWTCTDEEGTEIIQAETGHNTENEITANLQNGEYIAPKVLKKGNYIYKLEVKSGVCSKQSNKVEIIVHKTISTNRIRRRE